MGTAKKVTSRPGFFQRTSLYGFELFMALFGLIATLIVMDYAVFALFNYIQGVDAADLWLGDFTVWIVAIMAVWLPVTLIFYLRSRNESQKRPALAETNMYKLLTSIYYFFVIIGAIGIMFTAVFALINLAITPDAAVGDVIVRQVLPSLVAILLHVGLLFGFSRSKHLSRVAFASYFGATAVALAIILLVVSAGMIRGSKQDQNTVTDLSAVQVAISMYANDNSTVPTNLSNLTSLSEETKSRLSRYPYTKVDNMRYQLCADFATDTRNPKDGSDMVPAVMPVDNSDKDGYRSYAEFYYHDKGRVCYKLTTNQSIYDKYPVQAEPGTSID